MKQNSIDLMAISQKADQLLAGRGAMNKHDRCTALIYFCIEAGMTDGNNIVGAVHLMAPELMHAFIGIKLKKHPKDAFWRKDPDRGYVLN